MGYYPTSPTLKPTHKPVYNKTSPSAAPSVSPSKEPSVSPTTEYKPSAKPTYKPSKPPTYASPTLSPVPTVMPETVDFDLCNGLAGDPMLSVTQGAWKLNGTVPGSILNALSSQYPDLNETCVAYNKDYNKNAILYSSYMMTNTTVALRSTENSDAYSSFPCSGYQKYVCVGESFSLKNAKLKIEMCGSDGSYEHLDVTAEEAFETDTWYTISFTAIGDTLTCSMTDTYTGDVKLSTTFDVSGYNGTVDTEGGAEIGVYSNSMYFKSFVQKDLSYSYDDE